jgi:hypothetical protein
LGWGLLAQESKDGTWRSLGIADAQFAAMVRRIVWLTPTWQGPRGNERRIRFFAAWFGHENRLIYELAYLELARAPYPTIKQLGSVVRREQLEPLLRDPMLIDWRPLAILLLSQSGEEKDRRHIIESFQLAEKFGLVKNLGAWATAFIELEGAAAVAFVQDHYFRQHQRKEVELVEVVKAMSLHGTEGRTELRDQIVAAYATLLDVHPEMEEYITKDLVAWKRTEFARRIPAYPTDKPAVDPLRADTNEDIHD